jgi:hypothetical protein
VKKFFIMLGVWFVLVVSVIVGSLVYSQIKSSRFDETAIPYLEEVVPALSHWQPDEIRSLMAQDTLARTSEEEFARAIRIFSQLGPLQSMQKPEFNRNQVAKSSDGKTRPIVEYTIEAQYERGDAVITINLIRQDGQLAIYHFGISSEVLAQ